MFIRTLEQLRGISLRFRIVDTFMVAPANNSTVEAVDPLLACTGHVPLISNERLKQLYAEMLRVRQHRNARSSNRTRKQNWKLQEAPIVGCTIDLRAEDSLIGSADLPSSTIAQRSVLDADSIVALATGAALLHRVQARGNLVVAFVDAGHIARYRQFLRVAHLESLPIIYVQLEKASLKTPKHTDIIAISVDKADVVAIYRVASEAIDKARRGAGPTLIHCAPFSLKKVSSTNHHSHDPIRYMEYYLRKKNVWWNELSS